MIRSFGHPGKAELRDLPNNPHFQERGGELIRLLAANFRPIRMQQKSNLHTML